MDTKNSLESRLKELTILNEDLKVKLKEAVDAALGDMEESQVQIQELSDLNAELTEGAKDLSQLKQSLAEKDSLVAKLQAKQKKMMAAETHEYLRTALLYFSSMQVSSRFARLSLSLGLILR